MKYFLLICGFLATCSLFAQKGYIRGNVFDGVSGQPIEYATVLIVGTTQGALSDSDGFYNIGPMADGNYKLMVTYVGFDTAYADIKILKSSVEYKRFIINVSENLLDAVEVNADKEAARTEVRISKITITPKQIRSLPATGGESDVAQYLSVLPGVISTGDQGGQLYIRGGSPIMNKVLLDGMTIYNPFHSIGFFSVFETETLRSVDVYTGGFNAEYGNRIGAVLDVKTREGNRKRLAGMVTASPFMAKAVLEGPIVSLKNDDGGSVSFLLSSKYSYLDRTDNVFYKYASRDSTGLPFSFIDGYGKLSFLTGNGSRLNVFGFNFTDRFYQPSLSELTWKSNGVGGNFTIVPPNSNFIINGLMTYSRYGVGLTEFNPTTGVASTDPRESEIKGFNAAIDFTSYAAKSELNYGFELNGFSTDFNYVNPLGVSFNIFDNTSELAGFFKIKRKTERLVIEPGLRVQYYASLPELSIEPRLGFKLNATKRLRFKGGAGLYSQNLISTVNEDDIVNLFVGFLASPQTFNEVGSNTKPASSRLQKSFHLVGGVEIDITDNFMLNVEPYLKRFGQLISINRLKTDAADPDFMAETGTASGLDISGKYTKGDRWYVWTTYSLGYVNRFDGEVTYPTNFDRRHNVNFLANYALDKNKTFEASVRWNYGSGFAFNQTQGFYDFFNFNEGPNTDILSGQGDIGIILAAQRNGGRLSNYHRLDASVKKTFHFTKYSRFELLGSVTNVYDRKNIFYVSRKEQQKPVYQLPIIPSVSMSFFF
jgi:CarboxypepD_reg-like domain/TonB-dependent Receptor Plug Domain